MRRILHILKKDIRCFRLEIVLVFLSAVISVRNAISDGGISQPEAFTALFWIAGTLLISRVIHRYASSCSCTFGILSSLLTLITGNLRSRIGF